jgi:hypothetical protein
MNIPLPARPALLRSQRHPSVARAVAFMVALLFVLCASLSAEAKKKKASKKGKTPSSSSKKSTGKGAPPADESESDDTGGEEKASSKKSPADESDEKEAAKPPAPPLDGEGEAAPPTRKTKAAPAPAAEAEGTPGGLAALRFGVAGKALFRTLAWNQDMGALAPYTLSPGPEVGAWLEAYPAAFATDGFAANIGVYGSFDYGIGAQSKLPPSGTTPGMTLTTKYQDFLAGVKVRIPVGMFIPYVAGAYGMEKFHLDPPDPNHTRPNFNYAFIRAGAGARVQFTPAVDMDLGAGYLIVTSLGSQAEEVQALYPNAKANGVDVNLSLGFRLTSLIGIRAGADFRQYGLSLHWRNTQPGIMAGGATDRYIGIWGGLEIVLDGVGSSGGGGEEGEAAPAKKSAPKKKAAPADDEPAVDTNEKPTDAE